MTHYDKVLTSSTEDPQGFWLSAAQALNWDTPPTRALDESNPPFYRWFPDGTLNVAHNALDRHVDSGRGDQTALIYDSPVTGTKRTYTYSHLRDEVAVFAGVLRDLGVGRGDRVVIYMPMVPEAAIAMLACARLGAVHSVVFGGFAAKELAVRIDDCTPKVVVSASCGIEGARIIEYKPLLDKAIELSDHKPGARVILQRPQAEAAMGPLDLDWADAMLTATPADPVPVRSTDPLYILYTSGTTGRPKGVVRDSGGYATALAWSMTYVYDVGPGQTIFTASDVGWVVGHSYIVYAPLIVGATTVLYEGKPVGTPDAGQFWRVMSEYEVRSMFTAPTAFRALRKADPRGEHAGRWDLSSLKYLFLAGERLDPETYRWASDLLAIPVIDHWWQTESGWPIVANPVGIELLPVKAGSPTRALPGWDVRILDDNGQPVTAGEDGAIVVKLPLPPGAFPTLWNDDDRFVQSYMSTFEGFYLTGDGGRIDADGYVFVMGRTDDVINVAGHRLSTGSMEEILASHPEVAECAVIGVGDEMKGQVPRGLVVLMSGIDLDEAHETRLRSELVQLVRDQIGAVASLKEITVVPALPKTRSGKILRKTMRAIADGIDEPVPSTIDDAGVLDQLRPMLRTKGRELPAVVEPTRLRQVLGHFAWGVVVITADTPDGPVGFTCQSFSSLSLDPPLISFSPARTSTTWPKIREVGRFCVNVLAAGHEELSTAFARSGTDKFAGVTCTSAPSGAPVLDGVAAWIDCTFEHEYPGGDHTIVAGRVHALSDDEARAPLLFHRGAYGLRSDGAV